MVKKKRTNLKIFIITMIITITILLTLLNISYYRGEYYSIYYRAESSVYNVCFAFFVNEDYKIINNYEELEASKLLNAVNEHNEKELQNVAERFDKEFFENNQLIMIMRPYECNNSKKILDVEINGNEFNIKLINDREPRIFSQQIVIYIPVEGKNITNVNILKNQTNLSTKTEDMILEICERFYYMIPIIITIITIILIVINIKKQSKENIGEKQDNQKKKIKVFTILGIIINIVLFIILIIGYYTYYSDLYVSYKPIIYIYPEEEMEVSVKVGYPDKLTHTYPKYQDEWKVIAKPDGNLVDIKTGRKLYALYWEGKNTEKTKLEEGFVVKGEDTIRFLEEKLEILGLNEREANEFIIYWLPKLENNKYNCVRFQTEEEINRNMPLYINPKPESIIRVMMEYKPLNKKIEVKEQKLETPKREGYTVVEWGGTEIK